MLLSCSQCCSAQPCCESYHASMLAAARLMEHHGRLAAVPAPRTECDDELLQKGTCHRCIEPGCVLVTRMSSPDASQPPAKVRWCLLFSHSWRVPAESTERGKKWKCQSAEEKHDTSHKIMGCSCPARKLPCNACTTTHTVKAAPCSKHHQQPCQLHSDQTDADTHPTW